MMRTHLKILFFAALCAGLAACSSANEPYGKTKPDTIKEQLKTAEDQKPKLSAIEIKDKLARGMTQDEVKSLVQVNHLIVTGALDGQELWRCDIGAKEGYSFPTDNDEVDVEGLQQKKLEGVLFVEWTQDNKVNSFALYYPRQNGILQEYRVFENGQIKESTPF